MRFSIAGLGRLFKREVLRDRMLLEAKRWFRDRGDSTLRLDYPLGRDSLVADLGGYRGDFAHAIHARHGCRVELYEPMPAFHRICEERFRGNERIACHPYGLGAAAGFFELADCADGSSFVRQEGPAPRVRAEVRSVSGEFRDRGFAEVDLLKINIEGGEFDLLPALIDSGLVARVRFLQVQFHNFVPDAAARRQRIREALARTHRESWNYEFVWESWSRRDS